MKNHFIKISAVVVSLLPLTSFAAGLIPCSGVDCNFKSLTGLVNGVIDWFLGISVAVAAITFAIAGAKILLNPGNNTELTNAKGMFGKTIVGMIIILCAWLVIHTVISVLVDPNTGALRFLGK